jgi:uncharacterized protein YecT (DUF1311 family)
VCRFVLVLSVAALLAGCGAHGHTKRTSPRIYVPQVSGAPIQKPPYPFGSPDGGDMWRVERWISYGGPSARAIAERETNDCKPTCVAGHHRVATTTIVFDGRVPCKGLPAYARFHVVRSTDLSVATVGETRDLTRFCGYVVFTPSLPCLGHKGHAVSVLAQNRCYGIAVRATDRKIKDEREAISRLLFDRSPRSSFLQSEQEWVKFRQASCAAEALHYAHGTFEPVVRAACTLGRNKTHLADLAATRRAL